MSAIRYLDDVPHIVRYGMTDDETEKCWIFFWRNGVRFQIFVDKEDVQGTPFYDDWKPLLHEHEQVGNQWHNLCDLIISTAMPTLSQLAPKREHWITLFDYLHTPAYRLSLTASEKQSGILAKVEEGPTDTGAYDLVPVSEGRVPLPANVPLYESKDLHVLNRDKDWRQGPAQVSTPDGGIFFFLGCQGDTRGAKKQLSNSSLDAIRAQLRIVEAQARDPSTISPRGVPQVCGVVTDNSTSEESTGSLSQGDVKIAEHSGQCIAGLLLTWIPKGKTLDQTVQALIRSQDVEVKNRIQAWRSRVENALKYLHQNGLYLGGRADWSYLNQYTVLIDACGDAWLNVSLTYLAADVPAEDAEAGMKADERALVNLFEEWLPGRLDSKRKS